MLEKNLKIYGDCFISHKLLQRLGKFTRKKLGSFVTPSYDIWWNGFQFPSWELKPIFCEVVANRRWKTIETYRKACLKLVAYERGSHTRGSIWSDFPSKRLVF